MPFTSLEFVGFVVAALGIFHAVPRTRWRARNLVLLVGSYLFYMGWRPSHAWLLLSVTVISFLLALAIDRARSRTVRRGCLALGVVTLLGILGTFKYAGFLVASVAPLVEQVTGHAPAVPQLALPIGVSFFTFEAISYVVDVYHGGAPARRFSDYALFLSFFPHLIAGPIVRAEAFLSQLAAPTLSTPEATRTALARIASGVCKKILLADLLGRYVDTVYAVPGTCGGLNALLAVYAYAFQIYFDFSGYTDLALGVAQLFGLRLPENFDRPYLAQSPQEFWQRWHISLSSWLRDYLYVPLGGNRGTSVRTYANVMVTMLLGGLWHGAAWHFVVWGGYHGALLVLHRLWRRMNGRTPTWLARLATFHLVALGWVLFRVPDLGDCWRLLRAIALPVVAPWQGTWLAAFLVLASVALHMGGRADDARARWTDLPAWVQGTVYGVLTVVALLLMQGAEAFIYFQF